MISAILAQKKSSTKRSKKGYEIWPLRIFQCSLSTCQIPWCCWMSSLYRLCVWWFCPWRVPGNAGAPCLELHGPEEWWNGRGSVWGVGEKNSWMTKVYNSNDKVDKARLRSTCHHHAVHHVTWCAKIILQTVTWNHITAHHVTPHHMTARTSTGAPPNFLSISAVNNAAEPVPKFHAKCKHFIRI